MPLSDEQIDSAWQNTDTGDVSMDGRALARWVESAATAPLLAQIAELKATVERGKSVVRHDLIALGERAKLIMELEAQLLEARKDAERLDWMIFQLAAAPPVAQPAEQRNCEWTHCPRRVGDACCNECPAIQNAPTE